MAIMLAAVSHIKQVLITDNCTYSSRMENIELQAGLVRVLERMAKRLMGNVRSLSSRILSGESDELRLTE